MIINDMPLVRKIFVFYLVFTVLVSSIQLNVKAEESFESWLLSYKKFALKK